MDTKVIEVRRNLLITQQIVDMSTSWTTQITTIPFVPDEVVVKMITYNSANADPYNSVVNIFTDLVDEGFIGSITEFGSCAPNLTFTLKRPVQGIYTFQLLSAIRQPFNYLGDISIHLEFIKYREVKEQKVY